MANNLFVSYDLHKPGQNYETVASAIKALGSWAKVHYSFWHLKSALSASDAATHVWQVMDPNDRLIVVDATNNLAAWYNLEPEVERQMKEHWHR